MKFSLPLLLFCAALFLSSTNPLPAATTSGSTKEEQQAIWKDYDNIRSRLMMAQVHGFVGDPLLPLSHMNTNWSVRVGEKPEEVLYRFLDDYANDKATMTTAQLVDSGKICPVLFVEARLRPAARKELVPIALFGDHGMFMHKDTPELYVEGKKADMRALIRSELPAEFKVLGQPIQYGEAEELARFLEQMDRERAAVTEQRKTENMGKLSSAERHEKTWDKFMDKFSEYRLQKTEHLDFTVIGDQDPKHPESILVWIQVERKSKSLYGVFIAGDTPKKALAGMQPIVRIGDYAIWVNPATLGEKLSKIVARAQTVIQDEEFLEYARSMGVDELGGVEDAQQLFDRTPELVPAAASAPATRPAGPGGASPAAAAALSEGGYLPALRRDEPMPPPAPTSPGPKDIPCLGWGSNEAETRRKMALKREQYDQMMAEKEKKIREQKAQLGRDDQARWDDNQNILREYLRRDAEKHAVADRQKQTRQSQQNVTENNEVTRSDAIIHNVIKENGGPRLYLRNLTNVDLRVEWDYSGRVGNEGRNGTGNTWVNANSSTKVPFYNFDDEECRRSGYEVVVNGIHWKKR
jgi:hypothetical protein